VKTTPNPKATKKSKGELVGPPPPPLFPPAGEEVAAGGVDGVVIEDVADVELILPVSIYCNGVRLVQYDSNLREIQHTGDCKV